MSRRKAMKKHSNLLYRFCRRYVNRVQGENNEDMKTNGEVRWLREVLPHCKTILDVGANIGEWTELAMQINPALDIHCFEPSDSTCQLLAARAKILTGRIKINQVGLGAIAEERSLHIFSVGAGSNSLYHREGLRNTQTDIESVTLMTLDGYCQQQNIHHVDLVKIDVEGHELDVFKGSYEMLSAGKIDRIQFEYGGTFIDARVLLKDIFALLLPLGYRLSKLYPDGARPVERYEQRLENFQYQNWVAIRKGIF